MTSIIKKSQQTRSDKAILNGSPKSTNRANRSQVQNALSQKELTLEELHLDMMAYGKKITSTKASAIAFLKRIGAPI